MKYIPQHARKEAPRTDDTPTDDLLSYIGDQLGDEGLQKEGKGAGENECE